MGKSIFESMYLPLPSPVQQMKERGNLEEAEAYLQHLLETGECLPEERRRFRAELEILRRLRKRWNLCGAMFRSFRRRTLIPSL